MNRDERSTPPAPDSPELQTAGVVHDVNQMLMVIIGRAEYLRRYGRAEDLASGLETIEVAARDAAAMLRRLGTGGREGDDAAVADLAGCVAMTASVILPPAGAWAAAGTPAGPGVWVLENAVRPGLVAALPPVIVREVLNNLVLNALEALPGGGRIIAEADAAGPRLRLWISDDGPGVPADSAAHVFAPGRSTSGETGRGIGLAACRQVLAARGADLDLAPSRTGGATFLIDLPAATAGAGPGEPPDVAGLAVLVVDDEPAVRDMLSDVGEAWGCRVSAVADAAAAERACAAGRPDVVLIDLNLPDGSGVDLAARLRERAPAPGVVVMTGLDRGEALAGLDSAAVDGTALKPIDLDDLRRTLAAAGDLGRARRRTAAGGKETK
jgi:CheY-like chemotaxis protein